MTTAHTISHADAPKALTETNVVKCVSKIAKLPRTHTRRFFPVAAHHLRFITELGGVFFLGKLLADEPLEVWLLLVSVIRFFAAARIPVSGLEAAHQRVLKYLRGCEEHYGVSFSPSSPP